MSRVGRVAGFVAGGIVAGRIGDYFKAVSGDTVQYDWSSIWCSAALIAAVCVCALAAFFPSTADKKEGLE